ncbi:four helix bundle protein [Hymenobacter gummosus]|uniref:Four helix bundle protein n=1 Tax=Hymenobacter gummosus TaxID=1776032 RepID=A0A431U774_9BACT|nr:four helix bundle protein [Hymenobacter gummosus]RTQ52494.1 four helix bundle protein [Hymenobacter gummosus]
MFDFRKLHVWQQGFDVTLAVYRITRGFPKEELFGLTSQMRRAAASVPHNLAEGCGRESPAELLRFLVIAMGSASELESQALLAQGLDYLSAAEFETLSADIVRLRKMLSAYYTTIKGRTEGQ